MSKYIFKKKSFDDKEVLLTLKFIILSIKPFEFFKWHEDEQKCTNFHIFYENFEQAEFSNLFEEIKKDLSNF